MSCDPAPVYTDLRVYSGPYDGVDWVNVLRLKSQHHDHIGANLSGIASYDSAGYDVVSLMSYSGNPTFSYSLTERMWPPENWVTGWPLLSLSHTRLLIPNAEEVGIEQHATSPFLTTYIEGKTTVSGSPFTPKYSSIQEMFKLIRANGGFPCLAHPWGIEFEYLDGAFCTEIFSAFAEAKKYQGESSFRQLDHNQKLVSAWDRALGRNQTVYGIAVNDHFGPYARSVPEEIRDSGKILVLANDATLEGYRAAFEEGRILAVRDSNAIKDQYPEILSIERNEEGMSIQTTGNVRWISHGQEIANGPVMLRSEFLPNSRYVRAEIVGPEGGSTVYTQAFVIRPVGDADGDYDIDERDEEICRKVIDGSESNSRFIAACNAIGNK